MKKGALYCLCLILLFSMVSCKPKENMANGGNLYQNLYKDIPDTPRNEEGLTWPEGQLLPTFAPPAERLDALNVSNKSGNVRTMMVSLQGIVNRKKPRIFLYSGNDKNENWPEIVGLQYELTKKEDDLILKYKDEIKGIIIYDTKLRDTLNLADTLAGQKDGLVCTEKQAEKYTAEPYNLPVIENYTGKFNDKLEVYNYLYDQLWGECTKRLIVGLNPAANGHIAHTRDLAVAAKAAVLWLDPQDAVERVVLEKFMRDCEPGNTAYAGWWTEEGAGVKIGSEHGIPTVPADYYDNYSVYAGTSRELDIPEVPKKPALENKFYIALAFSDGDNLQYVQHFQKTHANMWSNPERGRYPISWTIAPTLLDAGPQILNYYYQTATDKDCLISGPSGSGYTDPLRWNADTAGLDAFIKYAQRTDSYFRRTAFNILTIWNHVREDQAAVYANHVPSLIGFTVQELLNMQSPQRLVEGKVPLLAAHPRYDGDVPRVEGIIQKEIEGWLGSQRRPGFIFSQLVSWECGVTDLNGMAKRLEEKYGDKIEFVRADHLMMLYTEANGGSINLALQSDAVSASGEEPGYEAAKAFDGSFAKENGWQSSKDGEKWLMVDLKEEYEITRYNVMHAGTGYYAGDWNTADFKIQTSLDGSSWKDADTVKGNQSNIVDKYIKPVKGRYVRILITNPGADGTARIQEFEVYGKKIDS